MRLAHVAGLFVLAASASATVSPIATAVGAAGGLAALGTSLVGLATVPPVMLLLALVAKVKLLKLAPVALPIAAGIAGKGAIIAATKGHFARKLDALHYVASGIIQAPMKLTAVKLGAVAGMWAGGKAGLASYKAQKPSITFPSVIPASVLLGEPKELIVPLPPAPVYAPPAPAYAPPAPAYGPPAPEPEPEVPSYGVKTPAYAPPEPSYAPAPPAYVPAPPAYTPAPEVHYRKRREAQQTEADSNDEIIGETFTFMRNVDKDLCVPKTLCEIAFDPSIAKDYGDDIISFLGALKEDPSAPWMPYKIALLQGKLSSNREECGLAYSSCTKDAEDLIGEALSQLDA